MWTRFLLDPLRGKMPLFHVMVGAFVANVVLGAPLVLLQPHGNTEVLAAVFAAVGVGLIESVMLWRCAYNSPFEPLGVFMRASLVVSWAVMPFFLYVAISDPGSVQFGG